MGWESEATGGVVVGSLKVRRDGAKASVVWGLVQGPGDARCGARAEDGEWVGDPSQGSVPTTTTPGGR